MKILRNLFKKTVIVGAGAFSATLVAVNALKIEAEVATISVIVLVFIGYLVKSIRQNFRYISGYRLPNGENG